MSLNIKNNETCQLAGESPRLTEKTMVGDITSAPTPEERIWQVVAMIPVGKVATYGQVAALAGMPSHARLVGHRLRNLPSGTRLPWHRVVNANLRISLRDGGDGHIRQRLRLEREGVEFVGQRVARTCRWEP